ncbi:type IV secretion system protein [Bartonella henselae]|uniref:type IV secretion system protein n=1 Tax=Bartonella henselae TaxID=38323 RepID=UPI0003DF89F7|nr:type IV secretion system protein [Bartonella henselae]ETS09521.1 hypothetical protein Q653_00593 [Bartonella henselae JK 42]ETS12549.1 hypothetical protein Q652_00723 [Bartonella henselae JK 41]KEC58901.1 hypothetical protein O97_00200 [Bartonella henselae str. Zeus]KEC60939.1 hypothetical protein O95_00260 [Bartonella henselae JK 53]MDM9983480.1 type IV secretion system protein [Bartonella henselae]
MKKMVFTITISAILATQNLALAFPFGGSWGIDRLGSTWNYGDLTTLGGLDISKLQHAQKMEEELQKLLVEHEKKQKDLKDILEKIYKSITNGKSVTAQIQNDSFFLKDPQSIYNKDNPKTYTSPINEILKKEEISNSISEARKSIENRKQYAAIVDKAVSFRVFEQTENRSKKILELLSKINQTKDLKSIAELQTEIKAKLAMIQNEATKLQMVAHLRNTERELISHQKQQRNMKILNSSNTAMPTIRSIR